MQPSPELPTTSLRLEQYRQLLLGQAVEVCPAGQFCPSLGLVLAGGMLCYVRTRLETVDVFTDGEVLRSTITTRFARPDHVFLVPIVEEA